MNATELRTFLGFVNCLSLESFHKIAFPDSEDKDYVEAKKMAIERNFILGLGQLDTHRVQALIDAALLTQEEIRRKP